jgi:hypothetical protein
MKNSILKGVLAAMIVAAALIDRPLIATADGHGSDGAHLAVNFATGPYTKLDPATCDPTTFFLLNSLAFKEGEPACVVSLDRADTRFVAHGGRQEQSKEQRLQDNRTNQY